MPDEVPMSDDPKPPVTVAVTPIPESFDVAGAVSLARDLAHGMYDQALILKKHGLSQAQFDTLVASPYVQKLIERLALEWNAPKASSERLAVGASVGLESVLPAAIARVKNPHEPIAGVAQLIKVLGEFAGVGTQNKQQAPAGERFKITINLGADTEVYHKTKPVFTAGITSATPSEVPEDTSGFGNLLTLQTEPEVS